MSALNQQNASNNVNVDTTVSTTTSNNSNNGAEDATTVKDGLSFLPEDSKAVEQSTSAIKATSEMLEQASEESNIDKTRDGKSEFITGGTKTVSPEPMLTDKCDENIVLKDAIEAEITNNISDDDVQSLTELNPTCSTGYKETVLDSVSDSELELRWPEDDDDEEDLVQSTAEPTTDTALGQLDKNVEIDVGKKVSNKIEDSQKLADDLEITENKIVSADVKSSPVQIVEQTKLVKTDFETIDGVASSSTNNDIAPVPSEKAGSNEVFTINTEKHIDKEFNITSNVTSTSQNVGKSTTEPTKLVDQNDTEISDSVFKKIDPATNPSCSDEKIILMDVDAASIESESTVSESNATSDKPDLESQSMDEDTLKHLVKDLDVVDEDDKISEIDIDETIVDLKHLIDQDEDTIKQLGLDVNTDKNVGKNQNDSTVDRKSKNNEIAETTDTDKNLTESVPLDIDLPSAIETATTSTNLSNLVTKSKNDKDQDEPTTLENEPLSTKTDVIDTAQTQNILSENIDMTDETDIKYEEVGDKISTIKSENDFTQNFPILPETEVCDSTDKLVKSETNDKVSETTSDSIKINTDHRINRPDVMLDIPSQDFDFDVDFDDSSESQKSSSNNDSSMTAKTVTEIVNQLNKDLEQQNDKTVKTTDVDMIMSESISDGTQYSNSGGNKNTLNENSKSNIQKEKQFEKTMADEKFNKFLEKPKIDDKAQILEKKLQATDSEVSTTKLELYKNSLPKTTQEKQSEKAITETMKISDTPFKHDDKINDETSQQDDANDPKTTKTPQKNDSNDPKPVKTSQIDVDKDSKTIESPQKDDDNTKSVKTSQNDYNNDPKPVKTPQIDSDNNTNTEETSQKDVDNDPNTVKTLPKDADKTVNPQKEDEIDPKTATSQKDDQNIVEPTTSKGKDVKSPDQSESSTLEVTKTSSDNGDEESEVTDRLGLLAESSRVMDDDDDEQEPDDDDEDDDEFDPDDEGSSNLHSEESNPPPSESDMQELDTKDNITIVENESIIAEVMKTMDESSVIKTEKDKNDVVVKNEMTTDDAKMKTDERRESITESLTKSDEPTDETKKSPDKLKKLKISKPKNVLNYVDLEESSSEDDAQESKESKSPTVTALQEKEKKVSTKEITSEASKDKLTKETSEIFNVDSDDDVKADTKQNAKITDKPRENNQCVNHSCTSDDTVPYHEADRITLAYYGAARWKRRAVCSNCLNAVNARNESLVSGIKDLRPLMLLDMEKPTQQLLEISDSDSEGDDESVGESGAKILEGQLPKLINEVWLKYKMDDRLKVAENYLENELDLMQKQSEEIEQLLKDCQQATDKLRVEFYSGFEQPRKELPAITLLDTPIASYTCLETEEYTEYAPLRYPKRSSTSTVENAAKKQAIPLGYVESETRKVTRSTSSAAEQSKVDEDRDISVVRLSAETAPADLPPPGELVRPPLRVGSQVYAMKNQYGVWLKGKVLEIMPKVENQYTQCRIRFEHKLKNPCKLITGRSLAYTEPSETRMTIGTRVIALFINSDTNNKRDSYYYSGVVAEIPNPVNFYRYLVFFDDGYAQYVPHRHTRLVYESSAFVWEEVHPFSRDFVCNYLMKYPERAMVRMHPGQWLTVERNGQWWETKVVKVDAALVCVKFPDERTEWIYRGSTRLQPLFTELQAAKRADRPRLPRSTKASNKTNMPYVEYTRTDDQTKSDTQQPPEDGRRQRVAKKSTALPNIPTTPVDAVVSRIVYYTPKTMVRPYKLVPHTCSPQCKRTDLLTLDDLKSYNPLSRPLLCGWERQVIRHKSIREIMYRAPCGRRLRSMGELHRYLRATQSDMAVDLFDFTPATHCLAEFVLNKTNVQKKDLAQGKENVPVPCVNYYDHSLPEFCLYNTERVPKAGVPLNLDPEFLCGCDCDDDCVDKTKCACWKMTLEGAKTIGIEGPNVGYEYRRLPEPLPSGIYECNSRCKCKSTCLNRVVQNPLQLKLQVFKTLNRGWGIRALNDVPKGSFLCIYAGNLLTDATANLDGLNEGDEYLAELDYIEVVEAMKEGYEEDVPEAIKDLDQKELEKSESEVESESSASESEARSVKSKKADDDFQPGFLSLGPQEFSKRLRRRDKKNKNKTEEQEKNEKERNDAKVEAKSEEGDDCITISDDEEVAPREPARFAAQENMSDSKVVSKYRSIRSYFGKDEACYIMDAKVQGNIGRYLNHSCSPNVFVQNVFVDTHDPRFPWVSFFALHHIKAGTELTWNYNYDVGSVPGKVLYCFCASTNCRGRLL